MYCMRVWLQRTYQIQIQCPVVFTQSSALHQPCGKKQICVGLRLIVAQITHPHLLLQHGMVGPRRVSSLANSTVSAPAFLFRDDKL